MTALLDTGPLVAAMDRGDTHHIRCVHLLEELPGPLLLPSTVLIGPATATHSLSFREQSNILFRQVVGSSSAASPELA